jgi:hypothetical protein
MQRQTFAHPAAMTALPGSGWASWAPEVADALELREPEPPVDWLGGLSLAMWACASLLALSYL